MDTDMTVIMTSLLFIQLFACCKKIKKEEVNTVQNLLFLTINVFGEIMHNYNQHNYIFKAGPWMTIGNIFPDNEAISPV